MTTLPYLYGQPRPDAEDVERASAIAYMNEQLIKKQREYLRTWAAALRSKQYKQVTGTLCDHRERMCCLGVACDVLGDGWWVRDEVIRDLVLGDEENKQGVWSYIDRYPKVAVIDVNALVCLDYDSIDDGNLPDVLKRKLGITADVADIFVNLNDVKKYSFVRIAEFIEKNFLQDI